ncbi:MAG: Na/Pi cotransporter family protein [Chloroflexi bacterium]|nr:MAG: Na/Pi cotransporter family protein [Chloroflexota bacterium]TMB96368.1 MAG: Na/Pi cotransporter family protein [Chloroflexota bacterium]TMC28304.1 MAG: Na/Pi cotransporter family protein [Chloroflexota bacterium]TMC36495.1 MAG: Na/Pi cotransporter family protein [Chloroflexota bacterium]TMC58394.1 MAG: Na/Pi cotransporter family protein [Chloroflexota bacterium]
MTSADLVLFSIFGGTALLLYGVRLVGEGLQRAAGTRLRHLLSTLTGNRFKALLVGAGVTAVLQSSSATTVMLVGFASAGLLTLRQTIGVILGADIGTTVTVQLLAFDLLALSPLVVFIGWLLYVTGRGTLRYVGEAILGFGFLFLGMKLVADGTSPLRQNALFADLLEALAAQPLILLLIAAAFSGLVRSSAATIGFALSLATAGVLPLVGAIPIIFGANIGTAVTALIAAVGQNAEARRVAAAHAAFKVVGVALFFPFIGPFSDLVARTAPDVPRQIANAHSIFNIAVAAIFLPLSPWAAGFFTRLIPERASTATGAIYLNPQTLDTPAVALGQALRETLRMGDVVVQSLRESIVVLEHDDEALMRQVIARDDLIDRLEEDIKQFLVQLGSQQLTEEQSERETALIFVIANLEEIGDVIEKNLMELAEKKIRGGHAFSPQGWAEIKNVHAKVVENLELALSALTAQDPQIAEKVIRHKSRINLIERQLRQTHIQRLHEGLRESIDTSSIHLDLLSSLKRANSLAAGIAYAVLGRHRVSDDNGG